MRERVLVMNIGCFVSKPEYRAMKKELKRRKLSMSAYLRQVAVRPLVDQAQLEMSRPEDSEGAA
jgi:hypothetical protein